MRSEQVGDKSPGGATVGFVIGAEGGGHGTFFEADFAPVRERYDDQRNRGVNLAGDDGSSAIHPEDRSVNRVAYEPVRTGAD